MTTWLGVPESREMSTTEVVNELIVFCGVGASLKSEGENKQRGSITPLGLTSYSSETWSASQEPPQLPYGQMVQAGPSATAE